MLLAQLLLRPIHVIRSGLTRWAAASSASGSTSIRTTSSASSARSSTPSARSCRPIDRRWRGRWRTSSRPSQHLEDAVAIVNPQRRAAVCESRRCGRWCPDAATGASLDELRRRRIIRCARSSEQTLVEPRVARARCRPRFAEPQDGEPRRAADHDARRSTIPTGELVGIMLVARNLEYLSQVQSTIRYSRKLAALGRLSAGVAHEVKNPLNAMMIHLELLRQQLAPRRRPGAVAAARAVPAAASSPRRRPAVDRDALAARRRDRRRDPPARRGGAGVSEVHRPEDLKLQPVDARGAARRSGADRAAGGRAHGRRAGRRRATSAPDVNGDPRCCGRRS